MQQVEKKIKVNYADAIRIQIILYCFMHKINLSDNEVNCLIVLCSFREYNLSKFCIHVAELGVFKSPQTVRNFIVKAISLKLVEKTDTGIKISDKLDIVRTGDMLIKYDILYVAKE